MGITEQQLQQLHDYAAALLPPAEIAILLDIPADERKTFCVRCRMHEGDPVYEAFHRGRLKTKLELRQNVIKLAKAGSPAAEPLAEKYLQEQFIEK